LFGGADLSPDFGPSAKMAIRMAPLLTSSNRNSPVADLTHKFPLEAATIIFGDSNKNNP
jgi:hypothetical protein